MEERHVLQTLHSSVRRYDITIQDSSVLKCDRWYDVIGRDKHSDNASTIASYYSHDTNNNNNENVQQSNIALRSIDLLEDIERKLKEGHDTDG